MLETAILLDSFAFKQAPTTYTAMIAQLKYNNEVKIVDLSRMCTHVSNCNPSPKIAGKINVGQTLAEISKDRHRVIIRVSVFGSMDTSSQVETLFAGHVDG